MHKKPKISFDTLWGGGPLWVAWYPGPYGDAVEDVTLNGVGFFAPNGEILAVEFDHVDVKADHQFLEFNNRFSNRVEILVKKGKVTVRLTSGKHPTKKAA